MYNLNFDYYFCSEHFEIGRLAENNRSNTTLKTLYDIVEKGLGGKVKISIALSHNKRFDANTANFQTRNLNLTIPVRRKRLARF